MVVMVSLGGHPYQRATPPTHGSPTFLDSPLLLNILKVSHFCLLWHPFNHHPPASTNYNTMADPSPTPPDRGHEMLGLCFDLHLALKPPSLLNSSEDEDEDEDSENRTTFLPSYRPRSKFTIAVRYYVKVGKFFGEPGWLFTYRFTENENASLHTPCSDKAADEVRQKALMKSASLALGTRRCQIMRSGDWECAGCNKLAVTLRMFFISSDGDEDLKHTPSIFCDAVPICSRRPKNPCQDVAIAMIHKKIAVDFSTNLAAIRNRYCENCGHGKDIFFCTECGSVRYVSIPTSLLFYLANM